MRIIPCAAMVLAFACQARAEPQTGDALLTLNKAFRRTYSRSRAATLARSGPVIVADGANLVFLHGKKREEAEADLTKYHQLKAVAHVPLTVYLLLSDTDEDDALAEENLAELRKMRQWIARAGDDLPKHGFNEKQLPRQRKMLADSLAAVDAALKRQHCSAKERISFARKTAPSLLANIADAARLQIDGYHTQVSAWRKQMTAEQWSKLRVVVLGSQMPRKQNLAVQYFARLLGESGEGRRIVYAEGLGDEKRALNLLGTHLLDRRIATAFFDDSERMDRDLLSDTAAEYLRMRKLD